MKKLIKFLKLKLKIFLSQIGKHKISEIGLSYDKNNIQYISLPIIDLSQDYEQKRTSALLCSYEGDSTFASSSNYPVIESWSKVNKKSYGINNIFIYEQFKKLQQTKYKREKVIEDKVFLLPYYTSHFGHFAGDLLGQLLFYLKKTNNNKDKRKLVVITPSKKWDDFLKKFSNDKIFILTPREAVDNNYFFKDSKIFPRMSSVQNFLLAKNILNKKINFNSSLSKKIFITTDREDRISNISELKKFLKENNFEVVIPSDFNIEDLLSIIKSAKILISEKASILNNVFLIRNDNFFILSSKTEKNLDKRLFVGASIYKEYNREIFDEILCDDNPTSQNVRAFKKRIKVDIEKLSKVINETYN